MHLPRGNGRIEQVFQFIGSVDGSFAVAQSFDETLRDGGVEVSHYTSPFFWFSTNSSGLMPKRERVSDAEMDLPVFGSVQFKSGSANGLSAPPVFAVASSRKKR